MTYRTDGRPQDLSVDPEELLAAQRRSTKKRILVLAIVGVVLAAAGTTAVLVLQARSRAETARAWDRFATCLVGDLASASEKPSARVRSTQLAVMSIPPEKRAANGEEPWPQRCSPRGHALAEALRANGGSSTLADDAEKLAKSLVAQGEANAAVDVGVLVDKVFADAATGKLARRVATDVPAPPARATPMTLATLPPAAKMFGTSLALTSVYRAPFTDDTLRLAIDDKDFAKGPAVCTLAPGATKMACKKIEGAAAQMSPALRLWGTTDRDATPFVFAGDRGKSGVFRSDTGARVIDKLEYGAYGANGRKDGSLDYLVFSDKPTPETDLVHLAPDGKKTVARVVLRKESGNPYYATSLLWDYVAYKFISKDTEGIRLVVKHIEPNGDLGKPADVGRLDEVGRIETAVNAPQETAHITACRSGDATVLRAKGWDDTFVSFLVPDGASHRWTAPVEARGLDGTLTCRSGEATITRVWGGPMSGHFKGGVTVNRCTVSGCAERLIDINKVLLDTNDVLPREAKDVRAVDVDGKLLMVWSAGDRGGLRMRFAPADAQALRDAADTVLFDDHVRDDAFHEESTLVGFELVPIPGGALLLLGTVDGVYALALSAQNDAKWTPVATEL